MISQFAGDVMGERLEIPVPLYTQGVYFGLFGLWVETRSLVLLHGDPDQPKHYKRCSGLGKNGMTCCDTDYTAQFPGERQNFIPNAEIARAYPIARARFAQDQLGYLFTRKSDAIEEIVARNFGEYLMMAANQVFLYRNPRLTFEDWMNTRPVQSQEMLQKVLHSGLLDRCIELHRLHYLLPR